MRNKVIISFSLVTTALLLVMGCSSTSELTTDAPMQELEPPVVELNFEDVIKDKIWYTKLENVEGDSNKIYQIKIEFNTEEKTFEKETYKLERHERKNIYKSAGYNNQKGSYYYGKKGKSIFYVLTEDYDVSANSSKIVNTIDPEPKESDYLAYSEEIIKWDGKLYYAKDTLEGKTIGTITNEYDNEVIIEETMENIDVGQ